MSQSCDPLVVEPIDGTNGDGGGDGSPIDEGTETILLVGLALAGGYIIRKRFR